MDAWDCVSSLGSAGTLRLWRSPIHLLPSGFVDAGRLTGSGIFLGGGA